MMNNDTFLPVWILCRPCRHSYHPLKKNNTYIIKCPWLYKYSQVYSVNWYSNIRQATLSNTKNNKSLTYFFWIFDRDKDVKFVFLLFLFLFFQLKQILSMKVKHDMKTMAEQSASPTTFCCGGMLNRLNRSWKEPGAAPVFSFWCLGRELTFNLVKSNRF